MAKKLTKKEMKKIEDEKIDKISIRTKLLNDINSFWKDCEAAVRFYRSHEMMDKIGYYGDLKDRDEVRKMFYRYDSLKDLKLIEDYDKKDPEKKVWDVIHTMNRTKEEYETGSEHLNKRLQVTDLWINDIVWDEAQVDMILKMASKYGYERIVYTDSSTAVMETLTWLTKKGAKIVGTIGKKNYRGEDEEDEGLIIDIAECKVEVK